MPWVFIETAPARAISLRIDFATHHQRLPKKSLVSLISWFLRLFSKYYACTIFYSAPVTCRGSTELNLAAFTSFKRPRLQPLYSAITDADIVPPKLPLWPGRWQNTVLKKYRYSWAVTHTISGSRWDYISRHSNYNDLKHVEYTPQPGRQFGCRALLRPARWPNRKTSPSLALKIHRQSEFICGAKIMLSTKTPGKRADVL